MAISRDKKQALVKEFSSILESAKMTVAAKYDGTSVADMQELRRTARILRFYRTQFRQNRTDRLCEKIPARIGS